MSDVIAELAANTKRRRATEAKLDELRAEAAALIVQGNELGVSKSKLSELAGMTRQTIYTVLLREQARAA